MRTACSAARLQQQESSGSSSQGHDGCDSLSGCALGGSRCSGASRGGGSWGCLGGVGACGGVLGDLLQDVLWERTEVGMQIRDCQVPGLALGVSVSGLAWLALNMHALAVATLPSWVTCMLDSSHAAKLGNEMMIGFDKHVQQAGGAAAYRAGGCEVGATHTSVQPVHSTASGHGSLLLARHSVCTSRVYGLCAARLGTSCSHS